MSGQGARGPENHDRRRPRARAGLIVAISASIVLVLTLGCMLAVAGDLRAGDFWIVLMCGSPTLLLGGLFLWLGVRRLKR